MAAIVMNSANDYRDDAGRWCPSDYNFATS